jgi:hypothetical protein
MSSPFKHSRAQLAYPPPPEGWRDEEFEYSFDLSSNPAFQTVLTPGQQILDMVLQIERDAEFRWRAIQVSNPGSLLGLRFRTPDGTYMSDGYVPMENFSGFPGAQGGIPGGMPVALESEIVCPPGCTILLDAINMV